MSRPATPIALFAYNRPAHVGRALQSLLQCRRVDECPVYIWCDGSPGVAEDVAVDQTRRVVRQWAGALGAEVIDRDVHLGLARSIVGGVTELCDRFGCVIVIEDDHEVCPDFIDFMLQALERYEAVPDVYQVSGYMYPVDHPQRPDAFLLPVTTTRGWATWRRAWRVFDWDEGDALHRLSDPGVRRRFDLEDSYPYAQMLRDRLHGRNDSWGVLWRWAVFQVDGLVLYPRHSLVWVGGWDGTGRHCGPTGGDDPALRREIMGFRFEGPIAFPSGLAADAQALDRIVPFLRERRLKA